MKKFVLSMMIALAVAVFLPAMTCEARPAPITQLKYIIGNWYDTKGNLVLTVSNDYKINGCTVLDIDYEADSAGMYKIRIDEGNHYRTLELVHSDYDWHETLSVNPMKNNAQYNLRRTKEPRYFESIGGVYLGMNKEEVLLIYGQPSSYGTYYNGSEHWDNMWKYDKEGFDVMISHDVVIMIVMYKYGNRRFDWSGLSANSSKADFVYKYNKTVSRRNGILIGHGEIIFIRDNAVELRLYHGGVT